VNIIANQNGSRHHVTTVTYCFFTLTGKPKRLHFVQKKLTMLK